MRRHAKLVMRENSFEKVQALLGNATQEVEELRESMSSLKKEILLEITNSLASPVRVVDGWMNGVRAYTQRFADTLQPPSWFYHTRAPVWP